jgi:integrase/recombinase XerD
MTGHFLSVVTPIERTYLMPNLSPVVEEYDQWMRTWTAEKTRTARTRMAARTQERFPDLTAVTTTDLTAWLSSVELKSWSRATYHGNIRAFFKWLAMTGRIEVDPTDSDLFRRPKVRQGTPKPLSPAEESRALAAASGNIRAWLLLALRAGFRAHEIAKVRGEDVTEESITVFGKGGKEVALPIHPDLWALAAKYPRRGWWFPSPKHGPAAHVSAESVSILIGRHFRSPSVDIPTGSIHRARHTYASRLRRQGVDLLDIQELMRHESVATTQIYAKGDRESLRAAINLLGDAS